MFITVTRHLDTAMGLHLTKAASLLARIDSGGEVVQVQNLVIRGSAELMAAEIRMRGLFRTAVEVPCETVRSEPINRVLQMDLLLQELLATIATIANNEEIEITADDLDVGFYHGDGLYAGRCHR